MKEIKKMNDKELEKEIMPWFNQWAKDEDADLLEYFKSVFIEGRKQATSDILKIIDKFREKCCLCINFEEKGDLHLFNNYLEELKQKIQEVGK